MARSNLRVMSTEQEWNPPKIQGARFSHCFLKKDTFLTWLQKTKCVDCVENRPHTSTFASHTPPYIRYVLGLVPTSYDHETGIENGCVMKG